MRIHLNQKKYIVLLSLMISLFAICMASMVAFFCCSLHYQSLHIPLAILSAFFFVLGTVVSLVFQPSMTAYEKASLANRLSKKNYKQVSTILTYENIGNILLKNGFKHSTESESAFVKVIEDNAGDGCITLYHNILVSRYQEDLKIESPVKEEVFMSTSTYLWIIFFDDFTVDILSKFKQYELNEIKRTEHKAFHRCCYYPVVLIHQGTAYYFNFCKPSMRMFLNLLKEKSQ